MYIYILCALRVYACVYIYIDTTYTHMCSMCLLAPRPIVIFLVHIRLLSSLPSKQPNPIAAESQGD